MKVHCRVEPCPVILNATCVFYEGPNLIYTGITTNDTLEKVIVKIDNVFHSRIDLLGIYSTDIHSNITALNAVSGTNTGDQNLSGFVPYTGATGAVNLGVYDLTVNSITVGLGSGNLANNTRVGNSALSSNISSDYNCAFGKYALNRLTSGSTGTNNAFGFYALRSIVSGGANNAFGSFTLANVLGSENTGFGDSNLTNLVNANGNIALGIYAGNYYGIGAGIGAGSGYLTISTDSIFIGYDCRALLNSSVNEIVMGYKTIGNGSNTATWGNTSITHHYFTGALIATGNMTGLNLSGTNTGDNAINSLYSGLVTMTYPSAGIAVSTGSAWGASIINQSANWNTAYGWGDWHSGGTITGALIIKPTGTQSTVYGNVGISQQISNVSKTFVGYDITGGYLEIYNYTSSKYLRLLDSGGLSTNANMTALSFAVTGGTAGEYLMADGSLSNGVTGFPGFGTTHALAAYGDHDHAGLYLPIGGGTLTGVLSSTVATGIAPFTVASTTMVSNLNAERWNGFKLENAEATNATSILYAMAWDGTSSTWKFMSPSITRSFLGLNSISTQATGGLTTNYLPKWNDSSLVNSLISDDGTVVDIRGVGYSPDYHLKLSGSGEPDNYYALIGEKSGSGKTIFSFGTMSGAVDYFETLNIVNGNVGIGTTDPGTYKLNVVGNINANDEIVTGSYMKSVGVYTNRITPSTGTELNLYDNLLISGGNATFSGTVTATDYKLSALNTAPISASATGILGEIRITTDYIYVCIATDTWVRSALITW